MNRDDYRKIKSMSKEEMDRWLSYEHNMLANRVRQKYNDAYHEELDNSIQNFITAIAYTLHYSEEVQLNREQLVSFMNDLFVSVDMFRKGEYKPEEYEKQLLEDGIKIAKYDYDKLYRENEEKLRKQYIPYKERNEKAIKCIEDFMSNNKNPSCNFGDLQMLQNILGGDL